MIPTVKFWFQIWEESTIQLRVHIKVHWYNGKAQLTWNQNKFLPPQIISIQHRHFENARKTGNKGNT